MDQGIRSKYRKGKIAKKIKELTWEENIEKAKHPYDLKRQGFYTLNIDLEQTGVGGTMAGTLPQYIMHPGKYNFEFMISPLN